MITRLRKRNNQERPSDEDDDSEIILPMIPDSDEEESGDDSEETESGFYPDNTLAKLEQSNPKIYQKFIRAKNVIKSREITILEILKAPIDDDKRANLIEKFECLKQMSPCTYEYISCRDNIRNDFLKYTIDVPKKQQRKPEKENEMIIYQKKIKKIVCSQENKKVLEEKLDEFEDSYRGDEKSKVKKWLNAALSLPFDNILHSDCDVRTKIEETNDYLDKKLFGMKDVKERLILFLNKKLRMGNAKGCNIALVGMPGVGKTAIAKALSHSLGLPFAQVSFGGVTNSDFLMGHDFTYTGSKQGEISRCLTRMESKNGILFFDEFDKVSDKKDIMSTLLHITDFSQNYEFRDNYFPELTQDLSKLWFIYSMNDLPTDPAMLDRLEIIKIDGYLPEERKTITKNYIIPKIVEDMKVGGEIEFNDESIKKIVDMSGNGRRGIRDLERYVNLVIEKAYFYLCNKNANYSYKWYEKMSKRNDGSKIIITEDLIDDILTEKKSEIYLSMYS